MLNWKFKRVVRNRYGRQIWMVTNRKGAKGYFKFPSSQKRKELRIQAANEYIAAYLAKSVGLPAATVRRATVKGPKGMKRKGLVSIKANAKKLLPWKEIPKAAYTEPEKYLEKADLLAQVIPFDAWIMNPDRTNHNLILFQNKYARRYKWYLIDHEIALFGKPNQWKLRKARKRFRCKKQYKFSLLSKKGRRLLIPKGLKSFWARHPEASEAMITKIEYLPRSVIRKALGSVPRGYLKKTEKKFIKNVLISRQKKVRRLVQEVVQTFWFSKRGIKTCK
ncbi:HipA family kinase [Brevibacillus centrosporus]|uniref:HipA family kinase n=1 Tax=Brevibacillus centrosporus TaxID=54910 RepID=UPI003B01727F